MKTAGNNVGSLGKAGGSQEFLDGKMRELYDGGTSVVDNGK
jgi:hypothetical protein